MKCPLLKCISVDRSTAVGMFSQDCLKEECAWWDKNTNLCAVKLLAWEQCNTHFRLQDLNEILRVQLLVALNNLNTAILSLRLGRPTGG